MRSLQNFLKPDIRTFLRRPSIETAAALGRRLCSWADNHAKEHKLTASEFGMHVDCNKGCALCCCQNIAVSFFEIAYLVTELSNHISKERIQFATSVASEIARANANDTSDTQRWERRVACGFVRNPDAACAIYPIRPWACRIENSISYPGCRHQFDDKSSTCISPMRLLIPISSIDGEVNAGNDPRADYNVAIAPALAHWGPLHEVLRDGSPYRSIIEFELSRAIATIYSAGDPKKAIDRILDGDLAVIAQCDKNTAPPVVRPPLFSALDSERH